MRRLFTYLFFTLLACTVIPTTHARQGTTPMSYRVPSQPLAHIADLEIPPIDTFSLRAKHAPNPSAPIQFAEPFDLEVSTSTDGTWEVLQDGSLLWRLRISAPGATDLNFGFSYVELPEGASLHILSEHHDYYQGPYTSEDIMEHGEFWTPVIPGDRAVLELHLPADATTLPEVWLSRIGCGFNDLFKLSPEKGDQQTCNNDVVCSIADPWRDQIRSVARYTRSGLFLCTGTMMRDVPTSLRSFFLTADHCGISSGNAPSVVVYWNYESPTCGAHSGGSLAQNQTGATFLASKRDVDMCLIELSSKPNPAFNVFYSGWDRSGTPATGCVGIHHPAGGEKSISFNDDTLISVDSCIQLISDNTHWDVDNWESGTTEGGSSGSGIWDDNSKLLVGTLSGGTADCSNPNAPDCYGKFSVAWGSGSSAAERLRDWLDPSNTGAVTLQGVDPDDLVPPAPTLTFPTGGQSFTGGSTITVTWNRNGADPSSTAVVEYRKCFVPQNWVPIGVAAAGASSFSWAIPHHACNGYQVRVRQRNVAGDSANSTGGSFEITTGPFVHPGDFDKDHKWDVAVYEVNAGNWVIRQSANVTLRQQQFGYSLTLPLVTDFDGDGQTDLALYETTTGNWYIIGSTDGFRSQNFGYAQTVPVPGDYDGDGKTDLAVYEKSTGMWYIIGTTSGFQQNHFGYSATIPIPCDYDGDKVTDLAVFEPSTGTWYIIGSTAGFFTRVLGNTGTVPVPADYDGDGRCDVATYQASNGRWQLRSSRTGVITTRNFGYSGTAPVPCDFDGDNICDLAVYEKSTGKWFILQSTDGFKQHNWGHGGAIPIVPQLLINRLLNLTP